jgi:hypothetical protein
MARARPRSRSSPRSVRSRSKHRELAGFVPSVLMELRGMPFDQRRPLQGGQPAAHHRWPRGPLAPSPNPTPNRNRCSISSDSASLTVFNSIKIVVQTQPYPELILKGLAEFYPLLVTKFG